ncbi:MAG: SMC-Scp complex subunit ScpB [Candidatus Pacebacteria bacterium]|nr:SMC-Scp complex subunit ScpB [Candidatus Paceibacterota bacterium]
MNESLSAQLEAVLFFKNEPLKKTWLAKTLGKTESEIDAGVATLKEQLSGRGITLMEKDGEIALRTAPAYSESLMDIRKDELARDLGKAGLETLSIILYRGPVTRADIDYIRGVNSTFILRSMLIRGLVEKVTNPKDARAYLYQPTFELLSYLGVSSVEELPEYQEVRAEITVFETQKEEKEEQAA